MKNGLNKSETYNYVYKKRTITCVHKCMVCVGCPLPQCYCFTQNKKESNFGVPFLQILATDLYKITLREYVCFRPEGLSILMQWRFEMVLIVLRIGDRKTFFTANNFFLILFEPRYIVPKTKYELYHVESLIMLVLRFNILKNNTVQCKIE